MSAEQSVVLGILIVIAIVLICMLAESHEEGCFKIGCIGVPTVILCALCLVALLVFLGGFLLL